MFFIPANIPAPRPIVPKEPKVSVNLLTTDIIPLKPLIMAMIESEFAIFSTVSVNVLPRRFNEPSHDLAVFSASRAIDPVPLEYSSSIFEYISHWRRRASSCVERNFKILKLNSQDLIIFIGKNQ